jgi:hypothetical protein
MLIKEEQRMSSIDVSDEVGIPSKAIWNPSGSLSSNSSVASTSTEGSNNEDSGPNAFASSLGRDPEPTLAFADASESELRMKIYSDDNDSGVYAQGGEDVVETEDDDRMGAMLMKSISSAHGPGSQSISSHDAKVIRDQKKNDKIFGTKEDERIRFVDSMATLSDKQLRTQLYDSFRLARVILGKPIKDKKKLSHKSILHAIRKVAEMKIQIIHMSEELDEYRQFKKKMAKKLKSSPGKENKNSQQEQEKIQEQGHPSQRGEEQESLKSPLRSEESSSLSSSISSLYTNEGAGPPSVREVISDSDSAGYAVSKLREQAIKMLQEESDLALSQIQEMDQRQKKRQRRDKEQHLPSTPASSNAAAPKLFLSPSNSVDEDDEYSYDETAADILYAFPRRSQVQQEELSKVMDSMGANRVDLDDDVDEIRLVLQRVVAFENERQNQQMVNEPEITTARPPSPETEVHGEVISLLTRLSQNPPATKTPSKEPKAEAKQSPIVVQPPSTKMSSEEPETLSQLSLVVSSSSEEAFGVVKGVPSEETFDEVKGVLSDETFDVVKDEEEDTVIAECEARLAAAKEREVEAIEEHKHFNLQKELLLEDIAVAKNNKTKNRGKLQLERLEGYKKELTSLLEREEERATQIKGLDVELNELATVCVVLEDTEVEFREKHVRHQSALNEFRAVTKRHTEKFQSLLGTIDRGITKQTAYLLGEKRKKNEIDEKSLSSGGSGEEFSDPEADAARKIQRLEYLLTKQNVELLSVKAKLKATGIQTTEKKKKRSFRRK